MIPPWRIAVLALFAAAPLAIAGCGQDGGELPGVIESAIDARQTASPDQPATDAPEAPPDTATPTPEQTPEQTPEPTPPEAVETADPEPAPSADDGESAPPSWAWLLAVAVTVALVLGSVAAVRRGRGGTDHDTAAQADGELEWARSNATDALIQWRAGQLRLPADQRDVDSAQARTWSLLDQRLTGAGNDLLTLQSGAGDQRVRQAAGMLQQATDSYRNSLGAMAASIATGDAGRMSQAAQALQVDTALFDQARQRFRQAAQLH